MTPTRPPIRPIVKWAGGKTRLLPAILPLVPDRIGTYYEPFIGGGAVCFAVQPERAVIADANPDLIALYRTVRDNPEGLFILLSRYKNTEQDYYRIRDMDRNPDWTDASPHIRAARLLYLNKTCFNGLYRVNAKGQFNVPYGKRGNLEITNPNWIMALHDYLSGPGIEIQNQEFQQTLDKPRHGDFVYLDPPYDPISETASFTSYGKDGFGKDAQTCLKITCDNLNRRGVKFLQSNSDTPFIRELYRDYKVTQISARRSISANGSSRQAVNELLISNY